MAGAGSLIEVYLPLDQSLRRVFLSEIFLLDQGSSQFF